jgi:hypothetical protein
MRVTVTKGVAPKHDGYLEAEDHIDEVCIPSETLTWMFKNNLWDRVNAECGTYIDEYEGVWLDPPDSLKAAQMIRQTLTDEREIPERFANVLTEAADMIENSAARGVRVMFSF